MPSLVDLVRRSSDQLASDHHVDAGLDEVVRAVERADAPKQAVDTAAKLLKERARALKAAGEELKQLRARIAYLDDVLSFTEEGWPERKAALEALLREDRFEGLAEWLEDWFTAASCFRTAALGRLVGVAEMPSGAALLLERCTTAARGLEQPSWHVARPILAMGAVGLTVGDRTVPEPNVRDALRLLLVRLALHEELYDEAERALRDAEEAAPAPAVEALWARLYRLQRQNEAAGKYRDAASADAPEDLDVAVELIEKARGDGRTELALDAARVAIDALPVLADIDSELGRLVRQPPAELWAAVAERALSEGDLENCAIAVDQAQALVPSEDNALQATVADLRVRAAEAGGLPVADQVAALVDAGSYRVSAGQLELAAEQFERARRLAPDNVDASLRLADCLLTLTRTQPLGPSRPRIDRALEIILEVQRQGAVAGENSWSYLSEADAHLQLAQSVSSDVNDHAWRAFVAVCRSIVHQPYSSNRWGELVAAGQSLALYAVPEAAAAHAVELDPDNEQSKAQHIQALTNAGRLSEALERLGDGTEPWDQAVRAYILVRMGDPSEAVRLLQTVELSPDWSWAGQTLISALLLTDRYEEAVGKADALRSLWIDRCDEFEGLATTAWTSVVLGDFDKAEELGSQLAEVDDEAESASTVAMARLLRGDVGDVEGGLAALESKIRRTRALGELDEWPSFFVPRLRVLASRHGAPLPPLDTLDELLGTRRAELEALADPVAELAQAPARTSDSAIVALGRALGTALLHVAREDTDAALRVLDPTAAEHADDPELTALRTLVRRQSEERTRAGEMTTQSHSQLLAREAIAAAGRGATDEAAFALRKLIDDVPDSAAALLRAEADGDEDALSKIAGVLNDVARSPSDDGRALAVLASLGFQPLGGEEPPSPVADSALEVVLPSSWFADHADPVNDHPLFLRYLPEIRLRASWEVPAIHVQADDGIEPAGYRILVLGELAEEGEVNPSFRYALADAIELLEPTLEAVAEPDQELGMMRLPAGSVAAGGMAELLTMSAVEVVARRIGEVADANAHRLGAESPQAPRGLRRVASAVTRVFGSRSQSGDPERA